MGTNLGDLLRQAGMQGDDTPDDDPAEAAAPEVLTFGPKVVLRRTKKGRGGRQVTLVQGVLTGHDVLMTQLKKELGVGARREDDDVVLQGDQVERVSRWLESHGSPAVVRGS